MKKFFLILALLPVSLLVSQRLLASLEKDKNDGWMKYDNQEQWVKDLLKEIYKSEPIESKFDINRHLSFLSRLELWNYTVKLVESFYPSKSTVFEFGVHAGSSINYFSNKLPQCTFYGFDVFDGLPENWGKAVKKGSFKIDSSKIVLNPNVNLIKGLFQDTVYDFVCNVSPTNISLIHIDSDLYSSAVCVLETLKDIILRDKPLILFDEFIRYTGFEKNEIKAFYEFVKKYNIKYKVICYNSQKSWRDIEGDSPESNNWISGQVLIKIL